MRLGQLARKLAVRQTEIVEFLTSQAIVIDDNSNAKLGDDDVLSIIKHFAPDQFASFVVKDAALTIPAEPVLKELENVVEQVAVEDSAAVYETISIEENHLITAEEIPTPALVITQAEERTTTLEVVKAPKVELPGLKIVGKIEIPEPKKKEPTLLTEEESTVESKPVEIKTERRTPREERKPSQRSGRSDDRARQNPIALQREREEYEERERKKEQARLEKEQRTRNYLKKVKVVAPVKAARNLYDSSEQISALQETKPAGIWARFMKWLKS